MWEFESGSGIVITFTVGAKGHFNFVGCITGMRPQSRQSKLSPDPHTKPDALKFD